MYLKSLTKKHLISLTVFLILLIAIPFTAYLAQKTQIFNPRAYDTNLITLDYTIPFRDSTVTVANPEAIKNMVRQRWPNAQLQNWETIVSQSIANGWNPAFVLTLWIEESGAQGEAGYADALGCEPTRPTTDINLSLRCLFNSFNTQFPTSDRFADFMCTYSESRLAPCFFVTNPKFPKAIKDWYSDLVPSGYGALQPTGEFRIASTGSGCNLTINGSLGETETNPAIINTAGGGTFVVLQIPSSATGAQWSGTFRGMPINPAEVPNFQAGFNSQIGIWTAYYPGFTADYIGNYKLQFTAFDGSNTPICRSNEVNITIRAGGEYTNPVMTPAPPATACGEVYQVCCNGVTCNSGNTCLNGYCTPIQNTLGCGVNYGTCCSTTPRCQSSGFSCNTQGNCAPAPAIPTPTQTPACGVLNKPCCSNATGCGGNLYCRNGICKP